MSDDVHCQAFKLTTYFICKVIISNCGYLTNFTLKWGLILFFSVHSSVVPCFRHHLGMNYYANFLGHFLING